jgi:hypothetical protein
MIIVCLLKKLPVVVEHLGSVVFTLAYHRILTCDNLVEFKSAHPISLRYLDDWFAMHRSITLVEFQLDAQNSYLFIYNTFITILYMF